VPLAFPQSDPRTDPALADFSLLDGSGTFDFSADPDFDRLVRLARILCGTSMGFLSFVGSGRQWIKSRCGLDLETSSRETSLCAFTMARAEILVIPDTALDPRTRDNPFVTGAPFIRFYAGVPLRSAEGVPLGAFCVADGAPRAGLTEDQRFGLETLARQVMLNLESRRRAFWRQRTETALAISPASQDFVGFWNWDLSHDPLAEPFVLDGIETPIPPVVSQTAIASHLDTIHPSDRAAAGDAFLSSIANGDDLRVEYRTKQNGAAERWMLARGRPLRDHGTSRQFPGILVDITSRTNAEEALVASEARFSAVADTMPQMVWSTRPDGEIDYCNQRWYEFTGAPAGSLLGKSRIDVLHPGDRDRTRESWRRSLATGEPYEIEYRLRHHSGRYRWALGRALPMRDADGGILRWLGTCTDIHDQKNATEERELVAQELSHRIKNTFLVISGLIGLYARTDPTARPFADDMRERILALGRAHNFIRPHSRASCPDAMPVTAHALFAELFAPYRMDDVSRIKVSGDDCPVDERAATPLALLFHELATNAVKYGALSSPDGTVLMTTARDADAYRIDWREHGGPEIDDRSHVKGFGTRVSQLTVEAQMGGTIERHWRREGLTVAVTLPLEAIHPREAVRPVSGTV
jgi:PAS domain S-box-containing protein